MLRRLLLAQARLPRPTHSTVMPWPAHSSSTWAARTPVAGERRGRRLPSAAGATGGLVQCEGAPRNVPAVVVERNVFRCWQECFLFWREWRLSWVDREPPGDRIDPV